MHINFNTNGFADKKL